MKRSFYILLFFFIGGGLCYFYQNQQTLDVNHQLLDQVHLPTINPLFEAADVAKYAQDYRQAEKSFLELLEMPLSIKDSQYIYNQLAAINLAMNKDKVALEWINLMEEATFPLNDATQADYLYNKGTWAYHTFQPKLAEQYLRKALTIYKKIYGEQHLKTANCLTQLGHLFYEFSDHPDSIFSYIPQAYDIYQTNPSLKKHSGYNELGMVYSNFIKRNDNIGLYHAQNAIHLLSTAPFIDSVSLARATSFKGQMLKKLGERSGDKQTKENFYTEATAHFQQALTLIKETHPRYQELLRNYLIIHIFQQDSVRFFQDLNQLQNNVSKYGNYYAYEERLLGYNEFANGKPSLKNYTKFIQKYNQDSLVGHALKTEAFYCLMSTYNDHTAEYYNQQEAIRYANAWLSGKHDFSKLDTAQYADSLISPEEYNAMYGFIPLYLMGNSYWQKYLQFQELADLSKAISIFKRTDSLLFMTTKGLENNVMTNFQKDIGNNLYPTALKAVYEYYSRTKKESCLEDAFFFSERMKSDILYRDIQLLNNKDSIAEVKAQLDRLEAKNSIHHSDDFERTNQLTFLNRKLEKMMSLHQKDSAIAPQTLATVGKYLQPHQAFLQYNLDHEQHTLHVLYYSQDTVQLYQYHSTDLKQQLLQYQELIKNYTAAHKNKAAFSELSYFLYEKLLKPFEQDLQKRSDWIIIPDRNLHQIPFESLLTSKTFTDYKTAPYLINRDSLTLSYSPSWKIFQLNSAKKNITPNDKLLYFTYGKNTIEIPCSGAESDSIKTIFGTQATVYTNTECTKKQFLNAWQKDYGMLHLSLHAQGTTNNIFDNKIWFQPNSKDALYGFELTGTQTSIKLVVLSACETNVGNTETGEGVYSMARYFFQSNVKTVVASLWQIEDCPNAQIIRFFYQQLKANKVPKQALCEAKRLFLKNSSDNLLAHPGYWAGMVCLD